MGRPRTRAGAAGNPDAAHAAFLSLLPRIELHGRVYFRDVASPELREELIAEMVALCWQWFVRLLSQGKDPHEFPSALASYAARAVQSGRKFCGQEPAKEVLSPLAQARHGFVVASIPDGSALGGDVFAEALRDNTLTPVPEQVSFRLDFPAWRATWSERDRRVIDDLMRGERTQDVAGRYGLSPARVSQLRREFFADWCRFCGDDGEAGVGWHGSGA
jgi:hypothetical protein